MADVQLTVLGSDIRAVDRTADYRISRPAPSRILVVGPVADYMERADLSAWAADVTDQTGLPSVVAYDSDHDVREYAAVAVAPGALTSLEAMLLWGEGFGAGLPVLYPTEGGRMPACRVCDVRLTIDSFESGPDLCGPCAGTGMGCSVCGTADVDEPQSSDDGASWWPACTDCVVTSSDTGHVARAA